MLLGPLPVTHELALEPKQRLRGPREAVVREIRLTHTHRLVVVFVAEHLAVRGGVGYDAMGLVGW